MNFDELEEERRRHAERIAEAVRLTVEREERGPEPCTCNWCLTEWANK